ncbi:MAG: hypothetical protein ACRCTZ_07780 [Sarcina sp.]
MLKVGDKVRIREDLVVGKQYTSKDGFSSNGVSEDMINFRGNIATVIRISSTSFESVRLDIDGGLWSWIDTMFDEYEDIDNESSYNVKELVQKCLDQLWDYERVEEKPKNEIIFEKQDFVHSDVKKVIRNGKCVIVILNNGSKGISKCHPEDEFNLITGYKIAYHRANILRNELDSLWSESTIKYHAGTFKR